MQLRPLLVPTWRARGFGMQQARPALASNSYVEQDVEAGAGVFDRACADVSLKWS